MATKGKKNSNTGVEATKPAFLGERDGVAVGEIEGGYTVNFGFDRALAKLLRTVPGAEFRAEDRLHFVPAGSLDALDKAANGMRAEFKAVQADLQAIQELAKGSASKMQQEHKAAPGAEAQISTYREPGRFYGGEVINANARFIAQSTGFGDRDGAAFVTIHRVADLGSARPMKGDKIGIVYDEKFQGVVTDLARQKADATVQSEFPGNFGKTIDGVTVTERGDKIGVQFDINPNMVDRIRRVDGAKFHTIDKVWEVPAANREYVARAVHDMRNEFVLDARDASVLADIARDKMDGAKVSKAFTKDGVPHFGVVLAVGERYALQKAGQDKFSLHHLATLDKVPTIGNNHEITYAKGQGTVVDQDLQRAQKQAMGIGR